MAWSWGQSGAGALGGMATGASIGSAFGPWGTLIGGGIGGLGGLFAGLGGEGDYESQYNPMQQDYFQRLLSGGYNQLQNPYQGWEPIRQDALNTFNQQVIPGLTTMFNTTGGSSNYSSPTLQANLSGAGATLASRLAAAQAQYGQNQQANALSQIGLGLTPQRGEYSQGLGSQLLGQGFRQIPAGINAYSAYQNRENSDANVKALIEAMKAKA